MRVPKSVSAAALQKLLRGDDLDDEEREAVDVWERQIKRGLGRKTGAMPKGPLKRLRDDLSVAVHFAMLRVQGIRLGDAVQNVTDTYRISERTLWARRAAIERVMPDLEATLKSSLELEARKQNRPLDFATLKDVIIQAAGTGMGAALLEAFDASTGAEMLLDERHTKLNEINDGVLEHVFDLLRNLSPQEWGLEEIEAFVFLIAKERTLESEHCK
jgi:hypothetical protein